MTKSILNIATVELRPWPVVFAPQDPATAGKYDAYPDSGKFNVLAELPPVKEGKP